MKRTKTVRFIFHAKNRNMSVKRLEEQLHEQYAINNNANLASILVLTTSLLGVIGIYGYIFIHTTIDYAKDWGSFVQDEKYSLDVLLFATIAVFIILLILFYLSAYLGVNQRKEQFITYAIRIKHYDNKKGSLYDDIFPCNYHPFNKKKSNFIQGLYGEICCILKFLFWFIGVLTIFKIISNFIKYCGGDINHYGLFSLMIFLILFVSCGLSFQCIIEKFYSTYRKRENEYYKKESGKKIKNNCSNDCCTENNESTKNHCCDLRFFFCK